MKIAIIGAGNMGGAIATGLARSRSFKAQNIAVSNPHEEKLEPITRAFPDVYTTTSNVEVIAGADLIVLAVKPYLVGDVIAQIGPHVDWSCQMLMSLAAGLDMASIKAMIAPWSESPVLFRAIPNTAISVGRSMTFIAADGATADEIDDVRMVFDNLGLTDVIEERLIPAATALCSCGIAYVLRFIRASVEGAVELGLKPDRATEYVAQTLLGAAKLLSTSGGHPEAEIDRVTTPGGYTIKGLNAMEERGFTAAVIAALKASV